MRGTMKITVIILLLLSAGIALLFFINLLFIHTNYYKNLCIFENRIDRDKIPENLSMINLGSGYARFSFDYEIYKINGYNFAQSPQSLWYDYMILKQFTDRLARNCIVFINLPVFIFAFENYRELKYSAKYYQSLDKKYIKNFSTVKKILCTRFPVLFYGIKAAHIIFDVKREDVFSYDKCIIPEDRISTYVTEHYEVWKAQFSLKDTVHAESALHLSDSMSAVRSLLSEMIDYCLAHDFRPVLVTSPLCREMNRKFSGEFLDMVFYENLKAANQKNIPYMDLREHPDFQDDPDMFWNGVDWLSQKGRRRFMQILTQSFRD